MKRTAIARRTALVAKTPLARQKPLVARAGLTRARLIPRQAMRRVRNDTGPDQGVRRLVAARDGGRCTVCGRQGEDTHHRQPRGIGGSSDPAINEPTNLLTLCRDCHRGVESQRQVAIDHGYLVRRPTAPASVPVLLHGYGWALLHPDGTRSRTTGP